MQIHFPQHFMYIYILQGLEFPHGSAQWQNNVSVHGYPMQNPCPWFSSQDTNT